MTKKTFKQALEKLEDDIRFAVKLGSKETEARGYYLMGVLTLDNGTKKDKDLAKHYLQRAKKIATALNIKELVDSVEKEITGKWW